MGRGDRPCNRPAPVDRNLAIGACTYSMRVMLNRLALAFALFLPMPTMAAPMLLRPAQVFDGVDPAPHSGWQVLVDGEKIVAVGRRWRCPMAPNNRPAGRHADAPG